MSIDNPIAQMQQVDNDIKQMFKADESIKAGVWYFDENSYVESTLICTDMISKVDTQIAKAQNEVSRLNR